jgi:very-short-patch-repair endonuclease
VIPKEIRIRVESRRLTPIHRGVYLVGAVPPPHASETAALLALGRDAVLSHTSAARVWNLIPSPPNPVHVTIPPHRTAVRDNVEIHRSDLDRQDIRRRHRLALTSPPRTILDLAASYEDADLEHLVAEARYRKLAFERELRDQLHRHPHKPGSPKLRAILGLPDGPQRTRSPAERDMLKLLRKAGITSFEANARIHGYEVDLLWRNHNLAVEIDGYDGHSGRIAFERDSLKRATLTSHGITVMPVTGRQIRDDAAGVLARLRAALA